MLKLIHIVEDEIFVCNVKRLLISPLSITVSMRANCITLSHFFIDYFDINLHVKVTKCELAGKRIHLHKGIFCRIYARIY